jgi:bisphosphoglycerate-independent phosphoglycerate mutase (AlkP superfamily)
VLIANRRVTREGVSIMDIAPKVLKYSGVQIPGDLDGQPLF